jgi:hypothetical protein
MAFDNMNPFSLPASGDLSGSQYCAVTIDSNGRLALPSAGGQVIGILYTAPSAIDKAGEVWGAGSGIRKARYGGTVTAGQALKVDTSGRFITALAADVALGSAMAVAVDSGVVNETHSVIFFGGDSVVSSVGGVDDIVLGTTAPSGLTGVTYVQTTGTKTGVLPNGLFVGQPKRIIQSVAASTPIGTITGAFQTLAGVAATTLALGTAVAVIADFVWVVGAWRLDSAITGTGSSLS